MRTWCLLSLLKYLLDKFFIPSHLTRKCTISFTHENKENLIFPFPWVRPFFLTSMTRLWHETDYLGEKKSHVVGRNPYFVICTHEGHCWIWVIISVLQVRSVKLHSLSHIMGWVFLGVLFLCLSTPTGIENFLRFFWDELFLYLAKIERILTNISDISDYIFEWL